MILKDNLPDKSLEKLLNFIISNLPTKPYNIITYYVILLLLY